MTKYRMKLFLAAIICILMTRVTAIYAASIEGVTEDQGILDQLESNEENENQYDGLEIDALDLDVLDLDVLDLDELDYIEDNLDAVEYLEDDLDEIIEILDEPIPFGNLFMPISGGLSFTINASVSACFIYLGMKLRRKTN